MIVSSSFEDVGRSEAELKAKVQSLFDGFWQAVGDIDSKSPDERLTAVVKLYHSLENLHPFNDGNGRTDLIVLNTLLCELGLHPVSVYNAMESALADEAEVTKQTHALAYVCVAFCLFVL